MRRELAMEGGEEQAVSNYLDHVARFLDVVLEPVDLPLYLLLLLRSALEVDLGIRDLLVLLLEVRLRRKRMDDGCQRCTEMKARGRRVEKHRDLRVDLLSLLLLRLNLPLLENDSVVVGA
jgi:hypothetical protein